jgi:glycosyltransferase involved in cell wall biosynthesis
MPCISVIIPVWNRAHVIGPAIDSVVTQQLPAPDWSLEIIVVDDGSTDDLDGALHPYGGRIRLVRHERNTGAAAARNTGIAAATGDYLAFLDSDDVWMPNKLTTQIKFMQANGYAASCTACFLARVAAPVVIWPRYKTGVLTRADIVWGCFLSPGTTMICQPWVFRDVGVFDTKFTRHEDWDWLLRFTARHDLAYLAEPLARRDPSPHANRVQALSAIERIGAKHLSTLPRRDRRHLEAALAFDAAAAHFRQGYRYAALCALLKSLWLAPFDHAAISAVVAGRF